MEHVVIVGPSHVIRWEYAVKSGALEPPFADTKFVGGGGLPVWSANLLSRAKSMADLADRILLIVADFRFGNSLFGLPTIPATLFVDGHRNVSKEYLTQEADILLRERCLNALAEWQATFGDKLIVIHWTGLARRNEDILRGKYLVDGVYRHPIWNFDALGSDDMAALVTAPPAVIRALYVDDNLHPSALGFKYLEHRVRLKKPADALRESIRWLEEMVLSFSQQRTTDHLLITGDSIWVKSVVRLLYGRPLASLAQRGIFIKPLTFEQMPAFKKENEIAKVVFVTDQGPHRADFNVGQFSSIIHRVSGDDSTEVRLFPWALIAREIVSRRHKDLMHLGAKTPDVLNELLVPLGFIELLDPERGFDDYIELGEELVPNLAGVRFLLSQFS